MAVLRVLLILLLAAGTWSDPGHAAGFADRRTDASGAIALDAAEGCGEACHAWFLGDRSRAVIIDINLFGRGHRIRYSADWATGRECPHGRVDIARKIVGLRQYGAFIWPLLQRGFCPAVEFTETSSDAAFLVSPVWNDIAFDAERSRVLGREEFERRVIPAIRSKLGVPGDRWITLEIFVAMNVPYADALKREIADLLSDPDPSTRRETRDGQSDKATNLPRIAEIIIGNRRLVEALLADLDADASLALRPGYRQLVRYLAGIGSSVPAWGSAPVCTNPVRIARALPWTQDASDDATFLATLSRCKDGTTDFLRQSLHDSRPEIVATALHVWLAAATDGRSAGRDLGQDVVQLAMDDRIPTTHSFDVLRGQPRAASPAEDVALGLASLDLLSPTVESLRAAGKPQQADALREAFRQASERMAAERRRVGVGIP